MGGDNSIAGCVDCNPYMTCGNIPVLSFTLKCGKIFKDETFAKIYNILRFLQVEIFPDTFNA
jgi:hypothetical protein